MTLELAGHAAIAAGRARRAVGTEPDARIACDSRGLLMVRTAASEVEEMVTVGPAESVHAGALAKLAGEMIQFYGAAEVAPLELRISQINESLFADPPSAYALLAWDDGKLVGFAAYSFFWPAVGLTRSLYLKELYVAEMARHKGVGRLLIQRLYEIAVKNECSRVEWTTDRDNPEARRFYAELGVPVRESKLFYRIEGEELLRQAALPGY